MTVAAVPGDALLDHIRPRLARWNELGSIPADDWRELAALDVVGRETFAEVADAIGQLARSGDVGLVGAYAINEICHRLLMICGCEQLRPAVAAGEARLALALTERDSGSDMAAMATRAERRDDGEALFGEKVYISNATVADWFLVAARSGNADGALPAFTLFRVPAERVQVHDMHGQGARLMRLATVTLDAVPVADGEVLGKRGRAFRYVTSVLAFERAIVACICLQIARHLLAVLREHLTTRAVFGAPLADHEYHRLRYARWEARQRVLDAAFERLVEGFETGVEEAQIFAVKIEAAHFVRELTVEAQHLLGASGWVGGGPLSGIYDDVRWLSLAGGATEALLMALADRSLNGG